MDSSQYDLFRLCEQRFYNRYKLNITPPTKAKQLDRGTVLHYGNEKYYEALMQGALFQDAKNTALSAIRQSGVMSSDLEPEEISRILDVMEEYYDFWELQDSNLIIRAVEQPFLYLLHEDDDVRIHMAGKIDLLYDDRDDTNVPMDHKSYDREFPLPELSNQFRNYCKAVGSNVLIVNRIGFQKTLKPKDKFKRVLMSYDNYQLEKWKENVVKVIMYYLQCEAGNSWPMNETSCDKYHRQCEYFGLCREANHEARTYKMSRDFVAIEPWDVSKVLRKASELLEVK